jgi:RNA polymerase sigma-70 factor, ECF subfamily
MPLQASLDDEELVRSAQTGKQDAFTQLYERYLPIVYTRVRFKIPDEDVEDITQEIFIAVMKSLNSFKGNSKFSTWIWTLTNRKIADYYRSRRLRFLHTEQREEKLERSLTNDDGASNSHQDDLVTIRRALQKLPETYQEIILQRFVDQLPFCEIAAQNHQSLEATKSLFRRSVSALRKEMKVDDE